MKTVKGTTIKARFKALLAKQRSWEPKSATKSDTDEAETAFIQIMTEITISIDAYDAKVASPTAAKKDEQLANERSREVVRQADVARLKLGKRRPWEDSDEESKEAKTSAAQHLRPSRRGPHSSRISCSSSRQIRNSDSILRERNEKRTKLSALKRERSAAWIERSVDKTGNRNQS
jgi:hypothetical protein